VIPFSGKVCNACQYLASSFVKAFLKRPSLSVI
jgi:hypothetical protein